jgi:hypothetical protein
MSSPIIPNGALQRRIRSLDLNSKRSDPWTYKDIRGVIIDVVDLDTALKEGAPKLVVEKWLTAPGAIFVKVKYLNDKSSYHILDISEDERLLIYGNRESLIGRPVSIEYISNDIQTGKAYLLSDPINNLLESQSLIETFDIFMV